MTSTGKKLKDLIHNLRVRAQRDGWHQASRWFISTLVSLPCRRIEGTVFTRSLLEPLPVITPRVPLTLRLATEADLVRFPGQMSPSEIDRFRRRLARGRYCFVALDGEHLAAYCWATTQVEYDVDNLEMRLQPGDVYLDYDYTVRAYRRQGIQTAVHSYRLKYMKDLGCQRAVLIVKENNVASERLMRKLGYQEVDHLSFRRVLWKRSYHYRSEKF